MTEYLKMLHEIEAKKEAFEKRLVQVIDDEISKFHKENQIPIKDVYVTLANVSALGYSKQYIVSAVSVDLDTKP